MIASLFVDVRASKDLLCERALSSEPQIDRLYISNAIRKLLVHACIYRSGVMVLWKMTQSQGRALYDSRMRPILRSDIEKMQECSASRTYFFLASFSKPPEQKSHCGAAAQLRV
jgi:gamma-glutamyl phosphate reductase